MQVALGTEDVELIAARVADLVLERLQHRESAPAGWIDAKSAAQYAGCSLASLHKATAAREVRFVQAEPGGKCWFKAEWIDRWRGV